MKIIIQAGGKGTRLEWLTRNKPKCMVPVNNLPIIFYAFKKFKDAEFTIIADYKTDVLEKYLNAFASNYNFKIVKASKKGTISGIKDAIADYDEDETFMVMHMEDWHSDLRKGTGSRQSASAAVIISHVTGSALSTASSLARTEAARMLFVKV